MMVELNNAVSDHQRIMIRKRYYSCSESNRSRPLGCHGNEQFGRADRLPSSGVMLTDPRFMKAELVEPPHQLEIALHADHGIFVHRMEWGQEDAVTEMDAGHICLAGWGRWPMLPVLVRLTTLDIGSPMSRSRPSGGCSMH